MPPQTSRLAVVLCCADSGRRLESMIRCFVSAKRARRVREDEGVGGEENRVSERG